MDKQRIKDIKEFLKSLDPDPGESFDCLPDGADGVELYFIAKDLFDEVRRLRKVVKTLFSE